MYINKALYFCILVDKLMSRDFQSPSPVPSDVSSNTGDASTVHSYPDGIFLMTSPSESVPWFSHIDFWPKCTNREKQACDGLFESFE